MDVNSLSVGRENINEITETMSLLRPDHEVPVQQNKENNQNEINNDIGGHQNNKPVVNGSTRTKTTLKEAGHFPTTKPSSKTSTCTSSTVMPFRGFYVAEEIKKKRELQMQKLLEEEKKKRQHVANPMPNFKAIHSKVLSKESIDTAVMSPETPEVLRRGLATQEKLKKKKEEYDAKLAERPPIIARAANVLKKTRFEPKKTTHVTITEPFALKMSERLKERKEYDDNYARELSLRKKKEQQEKEENEARLRKMHRDNTVFKAKPNPFKKN